MAENDYLPIKVIVPKQTDHVRPRAGGSKRKVFGEDIYRARTNLLFRLNHVEEYFIESFQHWANVPGVAVASLKDDAIAKSHRPSALFNNHTCPIIGVRGFGELLISVTPDGIERLKHKIMSDDSHVNIANISTIESIKPFTRNDIISDRNREKIISFISLQHRDLKVKLFNHNNSEKNDLIRENFLQFVSDGLNTFANEHRYSKNLALYRIQSFTEETIAQLTKYIGIQNLNIFPNYDVLRTSSVPLKRLSADSFPPPEADILYPVVGVIDSGTSPENALLEPWISSRENFVPDKMRDHDHGSFVSGLIANAKTLNHEDERFPASQAKIIDVCAVPSSGGISELDLMAILDEVIPKYNDVKIWNLSLGTNEPCQDQRFSDLAIYLDEIQDRYGVTFIISAGNYNKTPLRSWPPQNLGEDDRICPPSDSVRGITVGSTAHTDNANSLVKSEEPSPFSRRGPGPVYIPKPDVSHYGGNCDISGNYAQTGVLSIGSDINLTEKIGTSFSTPLVSALLADLRNSMEDEVSSNLLKALLIHSSFLESGINSGEDLKYRGFGVPGDIDNILNCSPHLATMVFETELVSGLEFGRWPFPLPNCLIDENRFKGEIIMTLVYDPPLETSFGAEYCCANVEISLGTYDLDSNGKRIHKKEIPLEPSDKSSMFEKELLEYGFKWSPVKVYRRTIPRGITAEDWRLVIKVSYRGGYTPYQKQKFALLITIKDPAEKHPVYNDVISKMNLLGWVTNDLRIRDHARIQF